MALLRIPDQFTLPKLFQFANEIDRHATKAEIVLEFSKGTFFSPFAMLFIAGKFHALREKNRNLSVSCPGSVEFPYPAHMGFFKLLGFDHGRDIGEAFGSENYIPITELTRSGLETEPTDRWEEVPELIQRHADKLARMISRNDPNNKNLFDVLSYSIREVMRNVFEHGETDRLYYCAQYWPNSGKVEFAVIDFGIGVRKGLGTNPNFRFNTDKQAIESSLLPSVSGKTHLPRKSEVWYNSGYGLYMTNRLARNGGNFVLASGKSAIYFTRKTKTNYQTSFPGTALRFNMDVNSIGDVGKRLNEFRIDGAKLAQSIKGSGNRPPSAMSLLLRRDFSDF